MFLEMFNMMVFLFLNIDRYFYSLYISSEVNSVIPTGSPVRNVDDFAPDGGLDASFLDDDMRDVKGSSATVQATSDR